jgi:hypothetical protein
LKKRSKKLLSVWLRDPIRIAVRVPTGKSFLVLFFKKEHFSRDLQAWTITAPS